MDENLIRSKYVIKNGKCKFNKKSSNVSWGFRCKFIFADGYGLKIYKNKEIAVGYYETQCDLSKIHCAPLVLSELKKLSLTESINVWYYKTELADKLVSDVMTKNECKEVKQRPNFSWHDLKKYSKEYKELESKIYSYLGRTLRDTRNVNFGYINRKMIVIDMGCVRKKEDE